MEFGILDKIKIIIKGKGKNMRKDSCWLINNIVSSHKGKSIV